jgi:hypothetical protein
MLPLIGALAGSALGPTLGLPALTAGAIGSGLGSYLQTGSLERGLMTGLGSYLGGAALGKLMGPAAGATDPTMAKEAIKQQAITDAAQGQIAAGMSPDVVQTGIQDALGSGPDASRAFFSRNVPDIAPKLGMDAGALQVGSSTAPITFGDVAKTGLTTGTIGGALSYEPPPINTGFGDDEPVEIPDYSLEDYAQQRTPGTGYRPGKDPEFRYFDRSGTSSLTGGLTGMASGGIMRMQEGGEINDKQVVDMAIRAVEGKIAEPEKALAEYMNRFGQEALLSLVNAVRSGEVSSSAGPAEGTVRGAGDGMEDLIPASLGDQDVLLSEGEFVVPADVVSGIGNGSTDAGAERLYGMLDRVREMRNGGSTKQPPQIRAMDALPA